MSDTPPRWSDEINPVHAVDRTPDDERLQASAHSGAHNLTLFILGTLSAVTLGFGFLLALQNRENPKPSFPAADPSQHAERQSGIVSNRDADKMLSSGTVRMEASVRERGTATNAPAPGTRRITDPARKSQ